MLTDNIRKLLLSDLQEDNIIGIEIAGAEYNQDEIAREMYLDIDLCKKYILTGSGVYWLSNSWERLFNFYETNYMENGTIKDRDPKKPSEKYERQNL